MYAIWNLVFWISVIDTVVHLVSKHYQNETITNGNRAIKLKCRHKCKTDKFQQMTTARQNGIKGVHYILLWVKQMPEVFWICKQRNSQESKELNKEQRTNLPQKVCWCPNKKKKKNNAHRIAGKWLVLLLLLVTNGGAHSFIETQNQISVICCSFALKNCHFSRSLCAGAMHCTLLFF